VAGLSTPAMLSATSADGHCKSDQSKVRSIFRVTDVTVMGNGGLIQLQGVGAMGIPVRFDAV